MSNVVSINSKNHLEQLKKIANNPPLHAPKNRKLGPGPTPSPIMTTEEELEWKAYLLTNFGILETKDLDGRLHRSAPLPSLVKSTRELAQKLLQVPEDHSLMLGDAGGHGMMHALMINLLSSDHRVHVLNFGAFGSEWVEDAKQLAKSAPNTPNSKPRLDLNVIESEFGKCPDLIALIKNDTIKPEDDIVMCLNETTSGVSIPPDVLEKITALRKDASGITILDATSGALCSKIPAGISYGLPGQKMLGAPESPTIIVIDPKAKKRIAEKKEWPREILFNMATMQEDKVREELFDNSIIRSLNLKNVLELNRCLTYHLKAGGLDTIIDKASKGLNYVLDIVNEDTKNATTENPALFGLLVKQPELQGNFNIVLMCEHPSFISLSADQKTNVLKHTHELLANTTLEGDKNKAGLYQHAFFTALSPEEQQFFLRKVQEHNKKPEEIKLLNDGIIFDITPFRGNPNQGFFRFTTKEIESPEAKDLMDCLKWATAKALVKEIEKSKEQEKLPENNVGWQANETKRRNSGSEQKQSSCVSL